MKSGITPKSIALLFPIVLVAYFGVFHGLEHLRHRKGAWEVAFRTTEQGQPLVVVSQPSLGLTDARLIFHGETTTNAPHQIRFDRVQQSAPFGKVIYEDLTFLPGVVTFDLFGHEVELLPRVLIANKKEIPWRSGQTVDFWPTNKPAVPPTPPRKRSR